MVSDVSVTSVLNNQAETQNASTGLADDFNEFLTLLTIQLQNQDPLEPLDTNQLTDQLVAFTGVEQQINTNDRLDDLISLQLGNVLGGALGYVGLDVAYVGSEFFNAGDGSGNTINFAINGQATDVTVRIRDEAGATIFEGPGSANPGPQEFVWDGTDQFGNPVPAGTYNVQIDALDGQDNFLTASTVVGGRVTGVESQDSQLFLLVGERAVSLGNVLNVSDPINTTQDDITEAAIDAVTGDGSGDTGTDTGTGGSTT